jgi:hypothetical protein
MASTYSSLKIQLMGTGENSGTWGNITNTNLGTAIEEAITGSADVTFSSGTVTLTLTDTNSTQAARNLRLNLTGVSGGAQNLIVPAIEKVYIVNNGCADTITIKNSTGTGVAVPAGKTMYVYNTGANVVDAITHFTSLTLASPLPITSGGTGTNSTTYANLEANIFGVLPVANGGTGSNTAAFSGANITNLNATAISSGTIDNARTTAASANGASTIIARDASGNFTANTATLTTVTGDGSALTSLNATNISSGTVGTARLASGTANSATFLRGDQAWTVVTSAPTPLHGKQVFTSSGTFTVPAWVTAVRVEVIAAGGNGGALAGNCYTPGGGGAGGYVLDYVEVTPGGTATVTVGTNAGTRTSSFAGSTTITASGGANGTNASNVAAGVTGLSGAGSKFGVPYYGAGPARQFNGARANNSASIVTSGGTSPTEYGVVYDHGYGMAATPGVAAVGYGAGGGVNGTAGTNGLVVVEW